MSSSAWRASTYGSWHRSNPGKARRMLDEHPGAGARRPLHRHRGRRRRDFARLDRRSVARSTARRYASLGAAALRVLFAPRRRRAPCHSRSKSPGSCCARRGSECGLSLLRHLRLHRPDRRVWRGEDWRQQPPHPECDALARLLLDAGADPNDSQTLYNRHFHARRRSL